MSSSGLARWLWRWTWRSVAGFGLFVLVYLVVFSVLGAIPLNARYVARSDGVPIWLTSNGLHVGFILPLRHSECDWSKDFPPRDFQYVSPWDDHVVFGWGNRDFYLERAEISSLRLATALSAAFYLGRSAVHVEYMGMPATQPSQCRLVLSAEQYRYLVSHIRASFARGADGRPVRIDVPGYRPTDAFYEGVGRYGLFYTCNTWVNEAMRRMRLPTAAYAVFAAGLMDHVQGR